MRGGITRWSLALCLASCGTSERPEVAIVSVQVRPTAQDQGDLSAPEDTPLTLDIRVEPAFPVAFEVDFGSGVSRPINLPQGGFLEPASGGERVPFQRLVLTGVDEVEASVGALEPGRYFVFVDDGRGGLLSFPTPLLIRETDGLPRLFVSEPPQRLLADECAEIVVGLVKPSGVEPVEFIQPLEELEIAVVDFQDGLDATVDGLAVTVPARCGEESIGEPLFRISSQQPVARFAVRGRTTGPASFRVRVTSVASGELRFTSTAQTFEIKGEVAIVVENDVWQTNECQQVTLERMHPANDDSSGPPLQLTLELRRADGESGPYAIYDSAACSNTIDQLVLDENAAELPVFMKVSTEGRYVLEGAAIAGDLAGMHVVRSIPLDVFTELPDGEVFVDAPSVVAYGLPFPVFLSSATPTTCRLELVSSDSGKVLAESFDVDVSGQTVIEMEPAVAADGSDDQEARLRCVQGATTKPLEVPVRLRRCRGSLLADPFLDLSRVVTTDAKRDIQVSPGADGTITSVWYALGEPPNPLAQRLDSQGLLEPRSFVVPPIGELTTISAVLRDESGCPTSLQRTVFAGADPDRIVDVVPGVLEDQLRDAAVPDDGAPLVLRATKDTELAPVTLNGRILGPVRSPVFIFGPGAGLLRLVEGAVFQSSAFLTGLDMFGTGHIVVDSGDFVLENSTVRDEVYLDVDGTSAVVGPGVTFRPSVAPVMKLGSGVVQGNRVADRTPQVLAKGLFLVSGRVLFAQNAVANLIHPLVGPASSGEPQDVHFEFNTFHRSAPLATSEEPTGSGYVVSGNLFSQPSLKTVAWLASADGNSGLEIGPNAYAGYGAEPKACDRVEVVCRADDLFPEESGPEELVYRWCDAVDRVLPDASEWDKTGSVDGPGLRYYGKAYDYGHFEWVQGAAESCD